jgi:hypothetical protein
MSTQNHTRSTSVPATAGTDEDTSGVRLVIAAGFAVGAVLGMGGNFLPVGPAREVAHSISSLGLILGSALFAARFARQGRDTVAAGFALLALAEAILMSQGMSGDPSSLSAFATGAALYVPALLLASLPTGLPIWARIAGGLAAVPFGAHALLHWLGHAPGTGGPIASAGFMLLTVAIVGWIVVALRASRTSPG